MGTIDLLQIGASLGKNYQKKKHQDITLMTVLMMNYNLKRFPLNTSSVVLVSTERPSIKWSKRSNLFGDQRLNQEPNQS